MVSLYAFTLVLCATVLGAGGAILLKKGSVQFSFSKRFVFDILTNRLLVFGLLLYAVSFVLYLAALQQTPVSILYPFVSLGYVWVMVFSALWLDEKITMLKILGVLFILAGIIILSSTLP